jgi:hypothetical protein
MLPARRRTPDERSALDRRASGGGRIQTDTLPYTLYLILAELSLGGLLAMQFVDVRGFASRGFVKATMIMLPVLLGLTFWVAFTLEGDVAEGYRIDAGPRDVIVVLLGVLTGGSLVHNVLIYRDREAWGRILGGLLSVLAVVVLLLTAIMLRLPVWEMGLVFLSLLAGSLVIGFAAVGLSLGHWYLVTPRLPSRPLNEVTAIMLGFLLAQVLLLALAVALPVDEEPRGGRDIPLADDATFWLRIVVGLAMPLVFGWMAWSSSRIRSMMAATGLLYLVTALVLAGEIAARALLFDSGRPI